MRAHESHYERLHPRIRAQTRVDWRVDGAATHVVSNLANVSAGGAMVMTSFAAKVGAPIELHLLTEVGAVSARGRVAWADGDAMGVTFES
jgi:PilZ domain